MSKTTRDYLTDISKIKVKKTTKLTDVMKKMARTKSNTVVVVDNRGRLEGIITGTDIMRELSKHDFQKDQLSRVYASSVMSERVNVVPDNIYMIDIANDLDRYRLHTIVVVHNHDPVGIIKQADVTKWWVEEYL